MEEIGKIKSVAVKNFITYDLMKYFPGEYLNIIIGPNGTGKSTIVAAIVLGMGGNCKLLSRSKDISDFIKNGKQKANIEIDLVGPDGIVTFHREFSKDSKESFTIDGQKVSFKKYMEKIKEFNIQIDNLCQFLPQDRVQDFTKMNSQELLKNTQNSVCSQETIDTFNKLLEQREIQKNFSKHNDDNVLKLKDAEERNEKLKTQIDAAAARNALLEKMNMCTKKMAWMEFNESHTQLNDVKKDLDQMNNLVASKKSDIKPLKDQANQLNSIRDAIQKKITDASKISNQHSQDLEKSRETTENLESGVKRAKDELNVYIDRSKDTQTEIKEGMFLLAAYNQDLVDMKANLVDTGDYVSKMEEFKNNVERAKSKIATMMNQRSQINSFIEEKLVSAIKAVENKIAGIANLSNQRIDKLRNNFEDTYKAYEWISQNRDQFQGQIFNPVMVEISVKDKRNAKYLENTIPNKDLQSFVCTNKADMTILLKKLRNEMNLQVNVGYAEATNEVHYRPKIPIQQLHKFGFHSYLIDMIEGPAPILNMLCSLYNIHDTAVGNDQTFKEASNVPDSIRRFFSTNHRFSVQVSKYSNSKSTSSSEIKENNTMNASIDLELLAREKQTLNKLKTEMDQKKNSRTQIEVEVKMSETVIADNKNEWKLLNEKVALVKQQQEKVRKKELEIQALKKTTYDIPAARSKFREKVDAILVSFLKVQTAKVASLEKYKNFLLQGFVNKKKLRIFESSNSELEAQIQVAQEEVRKYTSMQEKIQANFEQIKMKCKRQQAEAKKLTDNKAPNQDDFPYTKQFSDISNEVTDLKAMMDDLQGKIECIEQDLNPEIFSEYEKRKLFIHELRNSIKNTQKDAASLESNITALHKVWYERISEVVDTINTNFSNYMKLMGFVGEVTITHKEEREYNTYGIEIGVQYRQHEKLQALTRFVQSGGERAVAIATYTMSLQHITKVPFRCVDEINQGMDPKNERKIFTMLMELTCQEGQSQYFFVTPKLLPDLPFNEKMTVSIVHNGEFIEHPYLFNLSEME